MNESRAFLFPGQGSQYVGMMKDLYEASSKARNVIDLADDILGYKLSRICFEGPPEALQQTENTQPAIFLHGYVLYILLRDAGIQPVAAAGHSLGEYTALVASQALSFEDGLRLVRLRGQLMNQAGEDMPGTMAAIVGLDADSVITLCNIARQAGIVQPANFNAPGQIVISGSIEGVTEAMEEAKNRGARLVKELEVSGAFHSPLMQSAQDGLAEALQRTTVKDAVIPVFANVTGNAVTVPDEIRTLLRDQIISPVRWRLSMNNMVAEGYAHFLEVGPGKVLQGLFKRIEPSVEIDTVDTWNDFESIIK